MAFIEPMHRNKPNITYLLRVTGLSVGNSPVTDEFPAKNASKAENVSTSWHHHV